MTPENFLNVLKGNKQAMSGIGSGKVIDRYMHYLTIIIQRTRVGYEMIDSQQGV